MQRMETWDYLIMPLEIKGNLFTTESPSVVHNIQATILSANKYLLIMLFKGKNTNNASLEMNA
jgi:hypothetical protein